MAGPVMSSASIGTGSGTDLIGWERLHVPTPALVVELDGLESNITRMASYCERYGTAWRPHSKVHKCPEIARMQRAAGAVGITCAKLSEAELMVAHGISDVLLANQILDARKLRRLAELQTDARVIAIVDCAEAVAALSSAAADVGAAIPTLVDIDIGMHRTGAAPGEAGAQLAQLLADDERLEFAGLMGYEGHVLNITPPAAKTASCTEALRELMTTRDLIGDRGLEVGIVSAGGTGSYAITAAHSGVTEVQAGGGIFMDAMYRDSFHVDDLTCALKVIATVTSRRPDRAIVDAGFKTLSAFHHPPSVLGREDMELTYLSAEHGVFGVPSGMEGPEVGERVEILVGYSDSTTFLHDHLLGMREGRVERVFAIQGRGLLT